MAAESHSKAMHLASLIALDISLDDFFCALATENINATKTMIKFSFFIFFLPTPHARAARRLLYGYYFCAPQGWFYLLFYSLPNL
jgi:hypothetical protein